MILANEIMSFGLEGDIFMNVTCQGDVMKMECGEDYVIKVLDAYYGRETSLVVPEFCSARDSNARLAVNCREKNFFVFIILFLNKTDVY